MPDSMRQDIIDLKEEWQIIVDDISTTDVVYVCKAIPGTLSSDGAWQIKKIDSASGIVITWADGDTLFNNVADNRASLSYS